MSRKVINVFTGGKIPGLNINIPYAGENVNIDLLTAENVEYLLGMDLATFFEKAKNIDYCVFNLVGVEESTGVYRESFMYQQMTRTDDSIVIACVVDSYSFNISIIKENDTFTTAVLIFQNVDE